MQHLQFLMWISPLRIWIILIVNKMSANLMVSLTEGSIIQILTLAYETILKLQKGLKFWMRSGFGWLFG